METNGFVNRRLSDRSRQAASPNEHGLFDIISASESTPNNCRTLDVPTGDCAVLHVGGHVGRRRSRILRESRSCLHCGGTFTPTRPDTIKNRNLYCCRSCAAHAPKVCTPFATPESTAAERVRANGLINSRVKRGLISKPTACDRCGAAKRLDSHHPDYADAELIAWVCRSCHMLCHNRSDVEREVAALARKHRIAPSAPAKERIG